MVSQGSGSNPVGFKIGDLRLEIFEYRISNIEQGMSKCLDRDFIHLRPTGLQSWSTRDHGVIPLDNIVNNPEFFIRFIHYLKRVLDKFCTFTY